MIENNNEIYIVKEKYYEKRNRNRYQKSKSIK